MNAASSKLQHILHVRQESLANAKVSTGQPCYIGHNSLNYS